MSLLSLFLIFAVLICGSILYYRKYVSCYYVFPTAYYLPFILKCIVLGKIPKHIPLHSFYFQYLVETCKRFQSEGLCIIWTFQPFLCIYSKEAFKIFSSESSTVNKTYVFDLFKEFFMNSLLTCGDDLWRKRRKMLNPVFYSPNLKGSIETINRNGTLLVENLQKYNSEASSNIIKFLKDSASRNVFEFLTDQKLSADEKNPEQELWIHYVDQATEMVSSRMFKPWLHPKCFLFLSAGGRLYLKTIDKAFKLAQTILDRMKKSSVLHEVKNQEEIELFRTSRRSFGQVIMEQNAKDSAYTSMDMQAELMSMQSAGYETAAHAMMWILFLIGHHPGVQDQIYEEVESVMGDSNEVSWDNLQNLRYLECVIKESLRIYPPIPFYLRRTERDVQCGKYTVPKGTNIIMFTYLVHRDPDVFPDPEKFDPGRFLNEDLDKKLQTYTFAEGVRNCIGKNFVMMELKIILAHVIKNFKVTSMDRREDVSLYWKIVLASANPLHICLTPRQPSSV